MAMVNSKSIKKLLVTIRRQLGREITSQELGRLIQGDCSVLSRKNKGDKK